MMETKNKKYQVDANKRKTRKSGHNRVIKSLSTQCNFNKKKYCGPEVTDQGGSGKRKKKLNKLNMMWSLNFLRLLLKMKQYEVEMIDDESIDFVLFPASQVNCLAGVQNKHKISTEILPCRSSISLHAPINVN